MVLLDVLLDINNGKVAIGRTESRSGQCPSCHAEHPFELTKTTPLDKCPSCGEMVYATDWLRLHEDVSDFGNNTSAITRMMNAIEHLLLVATIQQAFLADPRALGKIAFILDGPLAVFGQPAKLSFRIQEFLFKVNERLKALGVEQLLLIGLQKTGEVMDHVNLLSRFLPNNRFRVLDDAYRYEYIKGNDAPAKNFGFETYYGQDFLFKTGKGQMFCFGVPYPFPTKSNSTEFSARKVDVNNYGSLLARACDVIRHFELDLYRSAIVPVALAHRHASISIVPGGKVLDIITKTGLGKS